MLIGSRRKRFWLTRVLPLAAFGALVIAAVPADLLGASSAMTATVSRPAPKPMSVATPVPVIAPGTFEQRLAEVQKPVLEAKYEVPSAGVAATAPAEAGPVLDTSIDNSARQSATIGGSAVNVRSAAGKDADKLFVLPAGASVQVAETSNGWVHVYSPQGSGWIYKTYVVGQGDGQTQVQVISPRPAKSPMIGRTIAFSNGAEVRDGPSSSGHYIYALDPGERVQIADMSGNWGRISTSDGESGWVLLR